VEEFGRHVKKLYINICSWCIDMQCLLQGSRILQVIGYWACYHYIYSWRWRVFLTIPFFNV